MVKNILLTVDPRLVERSRDFKEPFKTIAKSVGMQHAFGLAYRIYRAVTDPPVCDRPKEGSKCLCYGYAENNLLAENFFKADTVSIHIRPYKDPANSVLMIRVKIRFVLEGMEFAYNNFEINLGGTIVYADSATHRQPQKFEAEKLTVV